jgi:signal transduction histidine kinase
MLLSKTLRSSTLKLALVCVALFGAAVFALLGYVYWSTAGYVRDHSDHHIAVERGLLVAAYDRAGRAGLAAAIGGRLAEPRLEGAVYLLADASFAVLAGNLRKWPTALPGAAGWGNFRAPEAEPAAAGRPLLRAAYETLPDGSHLLVGQDIDDLDQFIATIDTALAWGVALMLVLAGMAGVSITRRTVGRIEAINATSREIMRSGLGRRIPLRGTKDEWDQLAENLNAMLQRIEELVQENKQVSDNVAHDLRTPLTRMRGRLEKAYHGGRVSDGDRALIGDTIGDLDQVLRTFSSLLRISQIEAQGRRAGFRIVDLAETAAQVAELFDAAAEEHGGRITVTGAASAPVLGDRDLLFDAISNLLDNAIRHGGAGEIVVEVAAAADGAVVSVADHGPGIPADERTQVFKRFYRLERSRSSPGNGLGLSLVAAVAQLHEARIDVADNHPGLRIRVRFPRPRTLDGADPRPVGASRPHDPRAAAAAPAAPLGDAAIQ